MSYDTIASSTNTSSNLNYPGLPGSSVSSRIDHRYDRDWHRVGLIAGRTYQFDVTGRYGINGGAYQYGGVDPTLYLRNSSGGYLNYNDDGGYSTNSRITFTAPTTGTYYLDIGGYGSTTGGYTVSATDTSPSYLGAAMYPTAYPITYPTLWPAAPYDLGDDEVTQQQNTGDGVAQLDDSEVHGNVAGGDVSTTEVTELMEISDVSIGENGTLQIETNTVGGDDIDITDSYNTNSTTTTTIDNSVVNNFTQTLTFSVNGDNNTVGNFDAMNSFLDRVGTNSADTFRGNSAVSEADNFRGGDGDDELVGYRGRDLLIGDAGDDLLRGGNGRDVLIGGQGADEIYGGFGQNTFAGEMDGDVDTLYFKSDQFAYNWIYDSSGNQDGSKVDFIGPLDSNDRIIVQGVRDSMLSFGMTSATVQGTDVNGIGIFAGGTLEAVYTGDNLTVNQLDQMTTGLALV